MYRGVLSCILHCLNLTYLLEQDPDAPISVATSVELHRLSRSSFTHFLHPVAKMWAAGHLWPCQRVEP